MKIAYVSTYLPRECGIATFCKSTIYSMPEITSHQEDEHIVIAINDPENTYDYPKNVKFVIRENILEDYEEAAEFINNNADICVIQHEYYIYGGDEGCFILSLLNDLTVPSVVVMHTVLRNPSTVQWFILREIADLTGKVVVLSNKAREFCRSVYNIPAKKIEMIHHGIPVNNLDPGKSKEKLGLENKKVIITFGLIVMNKGIETILKALPDVIKKHPEVVYLCLGKTHPHVKSKYGERYRKFLYRQAKDLNLLDHVVFRDEFISDEELRLYLSAADVLVTPYIGEEQISSGPLTFAMSSRTAILSTPYWYAQEMLDDKRGILFGFNNSRGLSGILDELFSNDKLLEGFKERSFAFGKTITWPRIAKKFHSLLGEQIAGIPETEQNVSLSTLSASGPVSSVLKAKQSPPPATTDTIPSAGKRAGYSARG